VKFTGLHEYEFVFVLVPRGETRRIELMRVYTDENSFSRRTKVFLRKRNRCEAVERKAGARVSKGFLVLQMIGKGWPFEL